MILDTNALSAMADGEETPVEELVRAAEVAHPVIVLGEYRFGVARSRFRKQYEQWPSEMLIVVRVLEIEEESRRYLICHLHGFRRALYTRTSWESESPISGGRLHVWDDTRGNGSDHQ